MAPVCTRGAATRPQRCSELSDGSRAHACDRVGVRPQVWDLATNQSMQARCLLHLACCVAAKASPLHARSPRTTSRSNPSSGCGHPLTVGAVPPGHICCTDRSRLVGARKESYNRNSSKIFN